MQKIGWLLRKMLGPEREWTQAIFADKLEPVANQMMLSISPHGPIGAMQIQYP